MKQTRKNKKNTHNATRNKHNVTQDKHKVKGVITIGLIYANWCGHCQSLKPEWQKMKYNVMKTPSYKRGIYRFSEIEHDKAPTEIEKINSGLNGNKLSANGYPTIFKVNRGKLKYYQGNRTAGELQKWFLESSNEQPLHVEKPYDRFSMFNRIFGGKTKKNKSIKQRK